jgi:hypothetical protein
MLEEKYRKCREPLRSPISIQKANLYLLGKESLLCLKAPRSTFVGASSQIKSPEARLEPDP